MHPLLASVALRSSMCTLHLVLTRHLEDAFSALVKKSIRLIAIRRTRSLERFQDHDVPNFRISTVTVLSTFYPLSGLPMRGARSAGWSVDILYALIIGCAVMARYSLGVRKRSELSIRI